MYVHRDIFIGMYPQDLQNESSDTKAHPHHMITTLFCIKKLQL